MGAPAGCEDYLAGVGPHLPERRPAVPAGMRLARAARSPVALGVAVAVGALTAVAGLGLPAALGAALLGWVATSGVALLWRSPRPPGPDPFAVGEPWRRYVMAAVRHQRRFAESCASLPDGPLRQRLVLLGDRVDEATSEVWSIAQAGHRLSQARRAIGATDHATATLDDADPLVSDALAVHEDAAGRVDDTIAATERRLAARDAQRGAVVTRAIEVSATAGTSVDLGGVEGDLAQLVDEMESLRLALDELGGDGGEPR